MQTYMQAMLLEAENAEDAETIVNEYLEANLPSWCKEYAIGGRWDGVFNGTNFISFAENPTVAESVLEKFLEMRVQALHMFVKQAEYFTFEEEVLNYSPKTLNVAPASEAIRIVSSIITGQWVPQIGVFDIVENVAHLEAFNKRMDVNPERQYIVLLELQC